MAKTLIIKGADFSHNYIEQVVFSEKPCTGITLNKATTTIETTTGSETLVATVTPADTTDPVIWISSNTDIVEVANGVITPVGIGTATITAQCGDFSASCTVTCGGIVDFTGFSGAFLIQQSSSSDYCRFAATDATDAFTVGFTTGEKTVASNESADGWVYPVIVPKNATKLCVRCMDQYWGLNNLGYMNTEEGSSTYPNCAKKVIWLSGATNLGWGDKIYNGVACYGNDITLRTEDDYNALGMLIKQQSGSAITPEVIANTHIWFETE